MAGFYDDAPNQRVAFERDGTVGMWMRNDAEHYTMLQAELDRYNNEDGVATWNGNSTPFGSRLSGANYLGFIFPCLMDLTHLYLLSGISDDAFAACEFTTDDVIHLADGTWTSTAFTQGWAGYPNTSPSVPPKPAYRTEWGAFTAPIPTGIKAIRFQVVTSDGNRDWRDIHFYGRPSSGEAPDRLRIWHPTLDEEIIDGAYFDWAEQRQGDSPYPERDFRVKNPSATETATSVVVVQDAPTDSAVEPNLDVHELSDDGVVWSASLNIGDLAPGAVSDVLTLRRVTEGELGVWTSRVIAKEA